MMPHPAMQDWRAILGRNVRRLRQQKGLTQEQLAFEAKIDLTYMGGIERGEFQSRKPLSASPRDGFSVLLFSAP
jgi:ribosome-binding protein aMBF1 (putative translation factor)